MMLLIKNVKNISDKEWLYVSGCMFSVDAESLTLISMFHRLCFQLAVSERFRTVLTMRKHIDATSLALAQMY